MKKIGRLIVSFMTIFLLSGTLTTNQAFAINDQKNDIQSEKTSRAIEHYKKSVNVRCGNYGYSKVTVTISHNMTTGRKTVYAVDHEDFFDQTYVKVKFVSVTTTPSVGSVITGNTIKVKYTYSRGVNTTVTDTISL